MISGYEPIDKFNTGDRDRIQVTRTTQAGYPLTRLYVRDQFGDEIGIYLQPDEARRLQQAIAHALNRSAEQLESEAGQRPAR